MQVLTNEEIYILKYLYNSKCWVIVPNVSSISLERLQKFSLIETHPFPIDTTDNSLCMIKHYRLSISGIAYVENRNSHIRFMLLDKIIIPFIFLILGAIISRIDIIINFFITSFSK